MAEMIPEYAVNVSKAAKTLHKNLSRMLGAGYKVVQYLDADLFTRQRTSNTLQKQPKQNTGSLFWVQKTYQSLFIYISHSEKSDTRIDKNQADQLASRIRKNTEIKNILKLQQALLPRKLYPHKASLCPFLLFFPECENKQIKLGIKSHGLFLFGKESLQAETLLTLLRTRIGMASSPFVVNHLRKVFSPEIVFTVKDSTQTRLLDGAQEIALKSEITLPLSARRSSNNNLRVLNGVAGSGKTQVLIQRARLLRTLFPMQKILVLCHNRAINQSIKSQYQQLNPNDRKISITSFLDWCRTRLNIMEKIVFEEDISDVMDAVFKRQLIKNNISKTLFIEEVNFIKGRLIFTETDYFNAQRNRQDATLKQSECHEIWRALLTLNNELASKNRVLWSDIPRLLLKGIEEGKLLERYDHILIDEAQYFSPLYYTLIKKSLKPHSGQLYIAFDENQGFLNNRIHWQDSGLDLRGHSMRLLKSYRINPLIMRAAQAFHLNRLPYESDDIFAYGGMPNSHPHRAPGSQTNRFPQLLHFPSEQDEQTRLLKEIHKLINNRVALKDILILTSCKASIHPLAANIRNTLNLSVNIATLVNNNSSALTLCPLESATGLESPFVFITGIQHLFENETRRAETGAEQERHTLVIENTRKLYMGMTRASQQLTLMITTDNIPTALLTPHIETPTLPLQDKPKESAEVLYLHG